jgi:hypothetical protein
MQLSAQPDKFTSFFTFKDRNCVPRTFHVINKPISA